MPIYPVLFPPFDTVDTILNFARVIANDCGISLEGNLLSNDQPYTYPMLNLAWRKLQDKLSNNSVEAIPAETIIYNIPAQVPAGLSDPSINCYLTYSGYYDGISQYVGVFLPQELEVPIRIWERVAGQMGNFVPMTSVGDGLPTGPKGGYQRIWEWRDTRIWMPGASQNLDLRIRYKRTMVDITHPATEPVPLIRCAVALAYLTVEIFAASRGSTILPVFAQERDEAIKQIINITTRKKQRSAFRRIPYSRRNRR